MNNAIHWRVMNETFLQYSFMTQNQVIHSNNVTQLYALSDVVHSWLASRGANIFISSVDNSDH